MVLFFPLRKKVLERESKSAFDSLWFSVENVHLEKQSTFSKTQELFEYISH